MTSTSMPGAIERSTRSSGNAALWLIVTIAAAWTAFFLQPVLVPMAFALLLKFLLSPVVRAMQRRRVPAFVTATLLVGGGLAAAGGVVVALAPAAVHWTEELPERLRKLEDRAIDLVEPVAAISEVTSKVGEQVDDLAEAAKGKSDSTATVVRIEERSWLASAFDATRAAMLQFGITAVLLLLLLCNDGLVLRKLEAIGGPASRRWADALREIERRSSTYVGSMLLIHTGMGAAIAVVCLLCGMPNPWLWGIVGALGDAIPFFGPLAVVGVLGVVGLTTFDAVGQALVPPLAYVTLNVLESNLLTPYLLGRWLSLSPVAIVVAMTLSGFGWGVPGLVLAVPLLVVLRIVSDYVPSWRPLQLLIDGRDARAAPTVANLPVAAEAGGVS